MTKEKKCCIFAKRKFKFMKNYDNMENEKSIVNESLPSYSAMGGVSKTGRMTVKEYFDEVWKRVVEKHENL